MSHLQRAVTRRVRDRTRISGAALALSSPPPPPLSSSITYHLFSLLFLPALPPPPPATSTSCVRRRPCFRRHPSTPPSSPFSLLLSPRSLHDRAYARMRLASPLCCRPCLDIAGLKRESFLPFLAFEPWPTPPALWSIPPLPASANGSATHVGSPSKRSRLLVLYIWVGFVVPQASPDVEGGSSGLFKSIRWVHQARDLDAHPLVRSLPVDRCRH